MGGRRGVHCQRLEPHFAAAARTLRTNDPPILFGKVKVPDQIDVAKRFGIGGYPLLLIFRYGKQYNYTGPRDEEGRYIKLEKFLITYSTWKWGGKVWSILQCE